MNPIKLINKKLMKISRSETWDNQHYHKNCEKCDDRRREQNLSSIIGLWFLFVLLILFIIIPLILVIF